MRFRISVAALIVGFLICGSFWNKAPGVLSTALQFPPLYDHLSDRPTYTFLAPNRFQPGENPQPSCPFAPHRCTVSIFVPCSTCFFCCFVSECGHFCRCFVPTWACVMEPTYERVESKIEVLHLAPPPPPPSPPPSSSPSSLQSSSRGQRLPLQHVMLAEDNIF